MSNAARKFEHDVPEQVAPMLSMEPPLTERQRELLAIHDAVIADDEGMARIVAQFEALPEDVRNAIDEFGRGFRPHRSP